MTGRFFGFVCVVVALAAMGGLNTANGLPLNERDLEYLCASPHLQNLAPDHKWYQVAQLCQRSSSQATESVESVTASYPGPVPRSSAAKRFSTSAVDSDEDDEEYYVSLVGGAGSVDDIDDYGSDVVTYRANYIVIGGTAACEFVATMLEDPSTAGKTFILVGSGPDVDGQNDTRVLLWDIGYSTTPTWNLHSDNKVTRDVGNHLYPEPLLLGGATGINPAAMVKPPKEYWDDFGKEFPTWSYENMREIVNGVEKYYGAGEDNATNHGFDGHTVIRTFPPEPETRRWEQAFSQVLGAPIVENQDDYKIGVGAIGRGIDVDANGNPIRQNIYVKAIRNKTIPGHPDYKPNLRVFAPLRCARILYKNNGDIKGMHCVDTRLSRVVRLLFEDTSRDTKDKLIFGMDAVRIPPVLERSGIGNKTIVEQDGILHRHNYPDVGENLMSDYNIPSFTFGCVNVSACPKQHSKGHLGMAYFTSTIQKKRNNNTGLHTVDCQIGFRYLTTNAFTVSNFVNVYDSVGFSHKQNADVIKKDEIVKNRLFDHPDDARRIAEMVIATRQAAALLAEMGMPVVELSPGVATTGTTIEEIVRWVVRPGVGVPQYHNQGTTAMGKVVDEYQRFLGDRRLMIIGGSVLPRSAWLWTHSSHYFALISGRRAAIDLLTRPDM